MRQIETLENRRLALLRFLRSRAALEHRLHHDFDCRNTRNDAQELAHPTMPRRRISSNSRGVQAVMSTRAPPCLILTLPDVQR